MNNVNVIDIILFVFLVLAGIAGAKKGFLEDFSQKAGFVLGFFVALAFTKLLSGTIGSALSVSLWLSTAISYILLYMIGYLVVKYIGSVLKDALESNVSVFINSFLGFLLKIIEFLLIACVVIQLLYYQNLFDLKNVFNSSIICSKVLFPLMKIK